MLSHFFIDRPIFASVISIVLVIAGAVAMLNLPIEQYPALTPPVVTVTASYPGASAEVVANNVAAPIETQVNGADYMLYMKSTSTSNGTMTLTTYFDISRDPDLAQVDVQNRVNLALPTLPKEVRDQGVQVQKRSSTFMMVIALYSPDGRYDATFTKNYANVFVLDAIKRIPGANMASVWGNPDVAMRVWVKPDRMAQLGLTPADISNAINRQNQQFAAGGIGKSPTAGPVEQTFNVNTGERFSRPEEFENIILRAQEQGGTGILRLKDVGRAELGEKDYGIRTRLNGKNATLIIVYQQAGANALEVAKQVRATMESLKKNFPSGLEYKVSLDTTEFVNESISEVVKTFFEAVVLVILVVFLFLQSFRATIVPIIAVPVSIIGTFIGMTMLGFSINMLTLFGLVLAIGIVVDDAIVVIENVERNIAELALPPKEAAKRAMEEVSGPVVAIVLVLVAVFVPVAFLPGITGQLYKQFAITIAFSVVLSGVVALTLSPALAAIVLKPAHGEKNRFFRWFESQFTRLTNGYVKGVEWFLAHRTVSLLIFAGMMAGVVMLFKIVPGSFLPPEDQGYVLGVGILPDAASLDRTQQLSGQATKIIGKSPAVFDIVEASGYSLIDGEARTDNSTFFVSLKGFEERKEEGDRAFGLIDSKNAEMLKLRDGAVILVNPPSVPGLGTTGGFEFWVQNKGEGGYAELEGHVRQIIAKSRTRPELTGVTSTMRASSRQLLMKVDREKAMALGVPVEDVYGAVQTLFGSSFVSQFNRYSRLWWVVVQAEPEYRSRPEDIDKVFVRASGGEMVPLKALVQMTYTTGPALMTRYNNFMAAQVTGSPAPGYSSGQALAAMEEIAKQELPENYGFEWSGQAFEEKKAGSSSAAVFGFGLIMVFLILAAQYEKWSLPIGVMMAVPFALFGALVAVLLRGMENDVYFQIGLVTLIALAAKNAILIIEFAVMKREEGLSPVQAAVEAARLRLRPIVMTSLAFILGCVPLAIAAGASANSRRSIGTGVIGGMLGATVIAIFFIPLFYVIFETMSSKKKKKDAPASGHGHGHAPAQDGAPSGEVQS